MSICSHFVVLSAPSRRTLVTTSSPFIIAQDVHRSADEIKAAGWELAKEPTELPGIGTKIFALHDPDGYKIVFVDNKDFLKELEG